MSNADFNYKGNLMKKIIIGAVAAVLVGISLYALMSASTPESKSCEEDSTQTKCLVQFMADRLNENTPRSYSNSMDIIKVAADGNTLSVTIKYKSTIPDEILKDVQDIVEEGFQSDYCTQDDKFDLIFNGVIIKNILVDEFNKPIHTVSLDLEKCNRYLSEE